LCVVSEEKTKKHHVHSVFIDLVCGKRQFYSLKYKSSTFQLVQPKEEQHISLLCKHFFPFNIRRNEIHKFLCIILTNLTRNVLRFIFEKKDPLQIENCTDTLMSLAYCICSSCTVTLHIIITITVFFRFLQSIPQKHLFSFHTFNCFFFIFVQCNYYFFG